MVSNLWSSLIQQESFYRMVSIMEWESVAKKQIMEQEEATTLTFSGGWFHVVV